MRQRRLGIVELRVRSGKKSAALGGARDLAGPCRPGGLVAHMIRAGNPKTVASQEQSR
jgi:hypothetical protein